MATYQIHWPRAPVGGAALWQRLTAELSSTLLIDWFDGTARGLYEGLRRLSSSVAIFLVIDELDWQDSGEAVLLRWIGLWNELSGYPPRAPSLTFIVIRYAPTSPTEPTRRGARPSRLRDLVENQLSNGSKCVVLPELQDVSLEELLSWAREIDRQQIGIDSRRLVESIRQITDHGWLRMPLDDFVSRLLSLYGAKP